MDGLLSASDRDDKACTRTGEEQILPQDLIEFELAHTST